MQKGEGCRRSEGESFRIRVISSGGKGRGKRIEEDENKYVHSLQKKLLGPHGVKSQEPNSTGRET